MPEGEDLDRLWRRGNPIVQVVMDLAQVDAPNVREPGVECSRAHAGICRNEIEGTLDLLPEDFGCLWTIGFPPRGRFGNFAGSTPGNP